MTCVLWQQKLSQETVITVCQQTCFFSLFSVAETNSSAPSNSASPEQFGVKYAGQMRLNAIDTAQMIRERNKALEELRLINDRVQLNLQEFLTAEAELTVVESPEPVYEAEKEEKEMKMKGKRNLSKREQKGGEEEVEKQEEMTTWAIELNTAQKHLLKQTLSPARTSLERDLYDKPSLLF